MKIESTSGKGNFQIMKGSFAILKVNKTSWFSNHAVTKYKGINIEVKPRNFWRTKFEIIKNGETIGSIIYHWKRIIYIQWFNESEEQERSYVFKSKGVWKQHFELRDEMENLVLKMNSKWIWRKFNYDYEIEHDPTYIDEETLPELLIYCGYAAYLYVQKKAASSGG